MLKSCFLVIVWTSLCDGKNRKNSSLFYFAFVHATFHFALGNCLLSAYASCLLSSVQLRRGRDEVSWWAPGVH